VLNLEKEVARSASLHAEYIQRWTVARKDLSYLSREMRKLRLVKDDFYANGPTKEQGRGNYPSGVILKAKVPLYVDADAEMLELQGRIDNLQIMVDALEHMVRNLSYRRNLIDSIMNIRKWEGGA